jgi:hypothetical protein
MENSVGPVVWLVGKVQLRRRDWLVRRLDFHMNVPCPPRVQSGHDRFKAVSLLFVSELVATQMVADVVILAIAIRLPEGQQRSRDRFAICRCSSFDK